jgi:hypothetical protein
MTTLNDIIRRRTANKYAGTKLGTQIANEYETGSRAAQNLNPRNQRGKAPKGWGIARYKSPVAAAIIATVTPTEAGMAQYNPALLKKLKRWIVYETKEGPRASMIEGYISCG